MEGRLDIEVVDISLSAVREEIEDIWTSEEAEREKREYLARHNAPVDALDGAPAGEVFQLQQTGAGILPEAIAVAVFFAPALNEIASRVAQDIWAEFILPRLRQRLGEKSITPKEDRRESPNGEE